MSLRGVGIDVVDVARFGGVLDRGGEKLRLRWFTPVELAQPGASTENLARSFAVKEAVWKALRFSSIRHLVWRDIEAARVRGAMEVSLTGLVLAEARAQSVARIHADAAIRGPIVIATAIVEA